MFPSTPADPARFIGIGRADLTVSYTPDLLTAASKGLKVKALASVFDRNVEGIMVWKDSGITTPKQLEGHTVAIYDFPMAKLNWQTFASHYGIDTQKVKVVSEGNYGVPLMVSNKVDGIDAAAPSELVDSELQAKQSARFWVYLKQNGIPDFYWFIIAGNSDSGQKNPAAAKAFVSVTMKAVKWSFQHQKEAVNIFVQTYKKDVSPELATKAWAQIVKYDSTRFKPSKPAGWMDRDLEELPAIPDDKEIPHGQGERRRCADGQPVRRKVGDRRSTRFPIRRVGSGAPELWVVAGASTATSTRASRAWTMYSASSSPPAERSSESPSRIPPPCGPGGDGGPTTWT